MDYSISNETVNATTAFDGATAADYLRQTTEDLVSSNWNTVGEFTFDTNFVLEATNSQRFYRTVRGGATHRSAIMKLEASSTLKSPAPTPQQTEVAGSGWGNPG